MTLRSICLSLAALTLWVLPGGAFAQRAGYSASTDDRLNQLGRSIADLERQTEQIRRQNQQLQQQLDRMRSSVESRLERLEKGGSAKTPSARPAPPRQ